MPDLPDLRELAYAALASTAAIGAAALTRKLLTTAYTRLADEEPPQNPAADDTTWPHALLWAALSGATAGMARATARRGAAAAWSTALDESAPLAGR